MYISLRQVSFPPKQRLSDILKKARFNTRFFYYSGFFFESHSHHMADRTKRKYCVSVKAVNLFVKCHKIPNVVAGNPNTTRLSQRASFNNYPFSLFYVYLYIFHRQVMSRSSFFCCVPFDDLSSLAFRMLCCLYIAISVDAMCNA